MRSSQPLVIAHRGASATHPDNSWAAFRAAVSEGADWIEFDLVMNKDGQPVISHNYVVSGRLIAEMSAQELTKQSSFQIPDFGDVLDWASEEGMHLLIEIKDPNKSPQGPIYAHREALLKAAHLDDVL